MNRPFAVFAIIVACVGATSGQLVAAPDGASVSPDQTGAPQGWFFDVHGVCPTPDHVPGPASSVRIRVGDVEVGTGVAQDPSHTGSAVYSARVLLWPEIEPGPTTLSILCESGASAATPFTITERVENRTATLAISDVTPTGHQLVTLTGSCPVAGEPVVLSFSDLSLLPGDRRIIGETTAGQDRQFQFSRTLSTSRTGSEAIAAFCRNGASAEVRFTVVAEGATPNPPPNGDLSVEVPPATPGKPQSGAPAFTG